MRKIIIIVLASIAALCAAGVVTVFAMAPRPVTSAVHELPTSRPDVVKPTGASSATPAPPGTPYTTDATMADIPTWISPARELTRAHSIHVWIATAKCMHKLGYPNFHYRVFWLPRAVTGTSENFWTDGMSSIAATKALTAEFGPTHVTLSGDGCYGHADVALQHQYLDGK